MGAEVLAMCIASDLDRGPLGSECWPDFWWGRRLLLGYQGVGLVFGAQDAGLISGFQEVGLSSDGAHLQRCRPGHGDKEKREKWS